MPSCPEKRLKEGGKVRLGEKELLKSTHTLLSTHQNPTNVVVAGSGAVTTKLKEQYPSPEGERALTLPRTCGVLGTGTRLMTATRTDLCPKFCLPWPGTP